VTKHSHPQVLKYMSPHLTKFGCTSWNQTLHHMCSCVARQALSIVVLQHTSYKFCQSQSVVVIWLFVIFESNF
jgi:hypothetical protein